MMVRKGNVLITIGSFHMCEVDTILTFPNNSFLILHENFKDFQTTANIYLFSERPA